MDWMLQIIIYALSILLVLKGIEIFLKAFLSEAANRSVGIVIGIIVIAISIFAGGTFVYMSNISLEPEIGEVGKAPEPPKQENEQETQPSDQRGKEGIIGE